MVPKSSKFTTLESCIDLVKNYAQTAANTQIPTQIPTLIPTHTNLTPAEKCALQELKQRDDIVIKPADKDSTFVVMDQVAFLEEANRQLTDARFLQKTELGPH